METLAHIPDLTDPRPAPPAAAAPPRARPTAQGGRQPFPAWSVAALAIVAAVVWVLASWHEQERLARQRRPERLARQPAAPSGDAIKP